MHKCSKDAFVTVVHCSESKGNIYGLTIDKIAQKQYSMIWAFRLDAQKAKHEGFTATKVNGSLGVDEEYNGCPYCGARSLVFCGCGTVSCWHGQKVITCPGCGMTSETEYAESIDISGGDL